MVVEKRGIMLDLGAGDLKRKDFVSMDKRPLPGIDIVHDLEVLPYPLEDESVITMVASNIVEHLKPWLMIDIFNEWWRIAKPNCQLAISMPYGVSSYWQQDPTHCNVCNEVTWQYFDKRFPLYRVYEPKPWIISFGPVYQLNGIMEVILLKPAVAEEA